MSRTTYGTDDGFRAAMAEANRTRLRTIGMATCATAIAVALTGSLVPAQQSSGGSRLDMVTTPVTPRPTSSFPTAAPSPSAPRPPAVAVPAAPGTLTGPSAVTRPTEADERDVVEAPRRAPRRPQSTPMTRGNAAPRLVPDLSCAVPSTGWCFRAKQDIAERPAHVLWLEADLCASSSGNGGGTLAFPTDAEVEMTVLDSRNRVVWSYLADHPAKRQPHQVTYRAGAPCLRWTTKWFERSNAGAPLRPGTYRFVAKFLGTAPAGLPASTVTFRL